MPASCVIDIVNLQVDGTIGLNETALEKLSSFPEPLHIIAITGKARLGKSTLVLALVRRLLGEEVFARRLSDGDFGPGTTLFATNGGDDTVTNGIQMWSEPLPVRPDDTGFKYGSFAILDTEGTERGNSTLTAQLCVISCVLATNFVYHVDGSVGNTDFSALAHITSSLDVIPAGDANDSSCDMNDTPMDEAFHAGADADALGLFFPRLTIVSRSISNGWLNKTGIAAKGEDGRVQFDLRNPAMRRALDNILVKRLVLTDPDDGYNDVRECISTPFPSMTYLLSRAAGYEDVDMLETCLSEGPDFKPFPSFRTPEESPRFAASYLSMLDILIGETPPSPEPPAGICNLLRGLMDALNRHAINVPSAVFHTEMARAEEVIKIALAVYDTAMHSLREGALDRIDILDGDSAQNAKNAAITAFETGARNARVTCNSVLEIARSKLGSQLDTSHNKAKEDALRRMAEKLVADKNADQQKVADIHAQNEKLRQDIHRANESLKEAEKQTRERQAQLDALRAQAARRRRRRCAIQ